MNRSWSRGPLTLVVASGTVVGRSAGAWAALLLPSAIVAIEATLANHGLISQSTVTALLPEIRILGLVLGTATATWALRRVDAIAASLPRLPRAIGATTVAALPHLLFVGALGTGENANKSLTYWVAVAVCVALALVAVRSRVGWSTAAVVSLLAAAAAVGPDGGLEPATAVLGCAGILMLLGLTLD